MKSIVGTRPEAEQVLGLLFGNSKVSSHGEIDHGGGEIASIGTVMGRSRGSLPRVAHSRYITMKTSRGIPNAQLLTRNVCV